MMRAVWILACTAELVLAQNTPAPKAWTVGPIDLSGLIDGYYSLGFNHPNNQINQIRNFDYKANSFDLNMAKLSLEHTPDPIGFRVDLGFGRAFELIHSSSREPEAMRNVEQAFISLKPPAAKGFQVDFGKYATPLGAEVIETHSNWNYSRSLLYTLATPYTHFGVRTSMPFGKHFTGGFHVVNGWNNVDDNNSGKTVGFSGTLNSSKVTWTHNYMVGPEKTGTNQGKRQIYDTTLQFTPNGKFNAYINFDYGTDKRVGPGRDRWVGVAGAAKFQVNDRFALIPRLEWYNDATGFTSGVVQKAKELTMTAEFKMRQGILSRLEYRRDWSGQPYFNRGNQTANHRNQDTLLLGIVAYFGQKG
jgi:hypothetical protein